MCLEKLVGLSRVNYPCFSDAQPSGWNVSETGYYLTDPDYGIGIIDGCELQGWALLNNARAQAISELKGDLSLKLLSKFQRKIDKWEGFLGKQKLGGTAFSPNRYFGHQIAPYKGLKDTYFVITEVWAAMTAETVGTFKVSGTNFAEVSAPVTTGANTMRQNILTTPIKLPLFANDCDPVFNLFFDKGASTAYPFQTDFTCCSDSFGWQRLFAASGVSSSDGVTWTNQSGAMSLSIKGYLLCDDLNWICNIDALGDYSTKLVVARALQFKAAAIAISALIDTLSITPCSLYNYENLNSRRQYLSERYGEYLEWITQNLPSNFSNCYRCKDTEHFFKSKLLV